MMIVDLLISFLNFFDPLIFATRTLGPFDNIK